MRTRPNKSQAIETRQDSQISHIETPPHVRKSLAVQV